MFAYLLERQIRGIGRLSLGVCIHSTPERDTKFLSTSGRCLTTSLGERLDASGIAPLAENVYVSYSSILSKLRGLTASRY